MGKEFLKCLYNSRNKNSYIFPLCVVLRADAAQVNARHAGGGGRRKNEIQASFHNFLNVFTICQPLVWAHTLFISYEFVENTQQGPAQQSALFTWRIPTLHSMACESDFAHPKVVNHVISHIVLPSPQPLQQ